VLLCIVDSAPSIAVIDIGSNSIKSLVAVRDGRGGISTRLADTRESRISAGIGQARPRLSEDGMQHGLAAIRELLQGVAASAPKHIVLVATSAVRDAVNGAEFAERIRAATGCELRILSGGEEANLIGRGFTADPQLAGWRDFYVFDLGGGSLECLVFRDRRVEQAISLPLGCVRLAERHVGDLEVPFGECQRSRVAAVCQETFARSGFRFSLPAVAGVVFGGGTVTTVRAILGERSGLPLADTNPVVSVDTVRSMLDEIGAQPLALRQQIPGLPAARADVFPTALATVLAVAEIGGFSSFLHSSYNLRYGLAAEWLNG
jgi:exopolyphosphatase / guanosine-5'-triphosphate,3'-diphosphate pyrophosphatase